MELLVFLIVFLAVVLSLAIVFAARKTELEMGGAFMIVCAFGPIIGLLALLIQRPKQLPKTSKLND